MIANSDALVVVVLSAAEIEAMVLICGMAVAQRWTISIWSRSTVRTPAHCVLQLSGLM